MASLFGLPATHFSDDCRQQHGKALLAVGSLSIGETGNAGVTQGGACTQQQKYSVAVAMAKGLEESVAVSARRRDRNQGQQQLRQILRVPSPARF